MSISRNRADREAGHEGPAAMSRTTWLARGLFALAAGLGANSLLGPIGSETIRYRFSESLIYQGIGLDAVALFCAAPIAVLAGVLTLRRHGAGPVVAFIPTTFAAYMAPQYVIGPDYLGIAGNNEQFFVAHLALFVLAVVLFYAAWMHVDRRWLQPAAPAADRRRSWIMFAVAAFIAVGRWLPVVVDMTAGNPTNPEYLENPTSLLLIGFLDLGLVTVAAVSAGVGLRIGARWAREAAYAVIGWFALVPAAVAAMAIAMYANDDPASSPGAVWFFTIAGLVFTAGAALLYRPLFRREPRPAPVAPSEATSDSGKIAEKV